MTTPKKLFNYNLEALRGVASWLVVWGHATGPASGLDPGYNPGNNWFYTGPGHVSVLVFFVLSGYVIGIAESAPLNRKSIPTYLKKRFVRIYPIYFVCLLFALAVASTLYPPAVIISHLTMTQGLLSPTIGAFTPSWSLVYEVAFYALFIPISFFRINPLIVGALCIVVGCANAYGYSLGYGSPILPSYVFGFAFWLSGLALARYLAPAKSATVTYAWLLSFLLLFISLDKLDAPFTLFHRVWLIFFGKDLSLIPNPQSGVIAYRDLAWLSYCVVIVALFANKEFAYRKLILTILLLLPGVTFLYYYQHFDKYTLASILVATNCYFFALLCFFFPAQVESIAERIMKKLVGAGSISYGLYIGHFPILYLFNHIHYFSGSSIAYALRLTCFLMLSLAFAWWLEKKFQPRVKELLF